MIIKVLAIAGSSRNGNSLFLVNQALAALRDCAGTIPSQVMQEVCSLQGKKIGPCTACGGCDQAGECIIPDDFKGLFLKWLEADVVLYSVPVYHLGVPSLLKAFFDRLGNSVRRYYALESPKHLKVVGGLVQGQHFGAGQELTLSYILHHAVLLNCIPVAGDRWESYLGAVGWTGNQGDKEALAKLASSGDADTKLMLNAAGSVAKRAVELAAILKTGAEALQRQLSEDDSYYPLLSRLQQGDEQFGSTVRACSIRSQASGSRPR